MKKNLSKTFIIGLGCAVILLMATSGFSKEETKKSAQILPYKDNPARCNAKELSNAIAQIAKETKPGVVNVRVECLQVDSEGYLGEHQNPFFDFFGEDLFQRFFGPSFRQQRSMPQQPQVSQGSGFIISPDGYVMTNYHVVKGANKVTVTLEDGYEKEVTAEVIGGDPYTDVAILKISGDNLPYLTFGNSDKVQEGEFVIAIGNPFQLKATVTLGVISAKGRQNLQINDLEDFIQTDAAINPGNSGGPLLDLDGNVIGMNTAIVSRSGGYMGIGFAIPSNILVNIRDQLIARGEVTRGFLGVNLQPIDKDLADAFSLNRPEGALVSEVAKNSPAEKAGIKQGDIIIEINGIPVKSPQSLRNEILLMQPGATAKLIVLRDGAPKEISVILGNQGESAIVHSSGATQKLGLEIEELTPEKARQLGYSQEEAGVLVKSVKPGSIAHKAGIPSNSIIIAINHKKVSNIEDFKKALNDGANNNRILILLNYKGQMRFISLKMTQ